MARPRIIDGTQTLVLVAGAVLVGCSSAADSSGPGAGASGQTVTSGGGGSAGASVGTGGGASVTGATSSSTGASGGASAAGSAGGSGSVGGAAGSAGAGGNNAMVPDAGRADVDATFDASTRSDASTGDGGFARFSFFVTSIDAIRMLSGNEKGFGGDLRFGQADGLAGADEICRRTAEMGMAGAGQKTWRAFLSVVSGPNGMPVNAIDRVGAGPWYDRIGRLVAMNKADLAQNRPRGAAVSIINDLPNETGIPNGFPVPGQPRVDNHHTMTGSKADGTLNSMNRSDTCNDWTSSVGTAGKPRIGVAWPRTAGDGWISFAFEGGCAPGFNLVENAAATEGNIAVGSNGGYGGFYCLALQP